MRELRETAVKNKQAREQERAKEREQMRDQQKKFAVREQMRVCMSFTILNKKNYCIKAVDFLDDWSVIILIP